MLKSYIQLRFFFENSTRFLTTLDAMTTIRHKYSDPDITSAQLSETILP